MKSLDEVYNDFERNNIVTKNVKFKNKKTSIMQYKDNTIVCIDNSKFNDTKEEKVALEEEYQHYELGTFYKLDSPFYLIDKMEYKTRKHVYNELIPYSKLKELLLKSYTFEDLSEYFDVPMKDIFMAYFLYTTIENYSII